MDDAKSIREFEELLEKQTNKKPSSLYKNILNTNKHTYNPQDVIQTVYSQIKAIQMADTRSVDRCTNTNKSNFLNVNRMPVYEAQTPNPQSKFETQCVSDTQLINLVEGVEAIDTHTGVTQEFETTFAHDRIYETEVCDLENNEVRSQILRENTDTGVAQEFDTIFDTNKRENIGNTDDGEVNSQMLHKKSDVGVSEVLNTHKRETVSDMDDVIVSSQILHSKVYNDTKILVMDLCNNCENKNNVKSQALNRNAKTGITHEFGTTFAPDKVDTDSKIKSQIIHSKLMHKEFATIEEDISKNRIEINTQVNTCELENLNVVADNNKTIELQSQILCKDTQIEDDSSNITQIKANNKEQIEIKIQNVKTEEGFINIIDHYKELNDMNHSQSVNSNDNEIIKLSLKTNSKTSSNGSMSILANANINILPTNENQEVNNKLKEEEVFNIVENYELKRSSSPILNITRKRKIISPFVVSLEAFENFENIAIPIIEQNSDFNTAKHIINSQIMGKELILNSDTNLERMSSELYSERNYSPILELKSDELKLDIQDLNRQIIRKSNDFNSVENIAKTKSDMLKDEILFSSDEEIEITRHNEIQNLPLTLALDDSFEELSDDGTILVGFLTASNKPIQISTNSFEKAVSVIFEENDKVKEHSLTELVEKYDNAEKVNIDIDMQANAIVKSNDIDSNLNPAKVECAQNVVVSNNIGNYIFEDVNNLQTKQIGFQGFTTASNKKIKMTDEALERCQKVFKDIDLNEKYNCYKNVVKTCDRNDISNDTIKQEQKNEMTDENFDELLLQELDNIEMSFEDKDLNPNLEEKAHIIVKMDDIANRNLQRKKQIEVTPKKVRKETESCGFKTASNKNINISARALAHTKNVFQDIELEMNLIKNEQNAKTEENTIENREKFEKAKEINQSSLKSPARFKTKSSRLMKIFENIESTNYKGKGNTSEKEAAFISFNTAINKNIKECENALAKSKPLFKETLIKTDMKDCVNVIIGTSNDDKYIRAIDNNNQKTNEEFVVFQTANNKAIKISEAALTKSIDIFKDLDKVSPKGKKDKLDLTNFEKDYQIDQPSTCIGFTGFKTANNKSIKISDAALTKTIDIFKEIGVKPRKYENRDEKSSLGGFKTASNKNVGISEQALLKSKLLFRDIDTSNIVGDIDDKLIPKINKIEDPDKTYKNAPYDKENIAEKPIFMGFQTASKKAVNVTAEAVAKSKKIFEDIEEVNVKYRENYQVFKGFHTASNKHEEVTKDALINSKKILEDENQIGQTEGEFVGFKTAGNKNVTVSKKALAKCNKVFENIDIEPNCMENNASFNNIAPKTGGFKGFQTGSNKNVAISNEALAKSKKIFENIYSESNTDLNEPNFEIKTDFTGFQTASNQKVKISEEVLKKSKNLFDEINFTQNEGVFGFDTASNKREIVSKEALNKVRDVLNSSKSKACKRSIKEIYTKEHGNKTLEEVNKNKIDNLKTPETKIAIESIINTQVLNNFETSLYTEDFIETKPIKRSGSPILSCPKAKKKRFETPYSQQVKTVINFDKADEPEKRNVKLIKFTENYKKGKKYTLKDLHFEKDFTKIDPYLLNFDLDNILNFEFCNERNDFNVKEGIITIEDIKKSFTEATNKKLIPDGWIENHLKLILWKLISYEVNFPTLGKVCSVRNVIDQLKYRYDKELYNAERPILRKILEKDDVSTNTIVFCVAGIYVDGVSVISVTNQTNIELLLTDGWYFIKATIDKMLSKLIYERKIIVGCKIITEGAELVNCEQGISPWEDTSSVRLTISGNSTRPAPWDMKLGLRPIKLRSTLASVKPDGGRVRRLQAFVTRLYPLLYVEKFEDGSTVTRSERLEHIYQTKYEAERQIMIEKMYEEVEKEFCEQESQDSEESNDSNKRKTFESGSQIAKMMKKSRDPMEFRAQLTASQVQNLQDHTNKQREKYIQVLQDKISTLSSRNYVTLARARIVQLIRTDHNVHSCKGMLSVWKPNDAVLDIIKEGNWIEILNVVPTGIRNFEIQISAGRQSVFRKVKKEDKSFDTFMATLKRTCHKIKDLSQNPLMTTEYNEIDTAGIIFSIEPSNREFESNKTQFQNIYLADIDKNMICINFWGGIKKFGYENILDTGQVIFCANLQKRSGNTRRNVPQYRATEFSIFTKWPKNEKAREILEEYNKKLFGLDRRRFCEDCVAIKQNNSVLKCFTDNENVSPYRFHNNSAYNLGKHKTLIETPKNDKKEEFDLSGLDFESTFKQPETQEFSPKTLLRKKQVKEKIARLKMYGEPPPLSPMNLINISKNAANCYKSPLLKSETVATPNSAATANKCVASADNLNVATPTKLPDINAKSFEGSPIISMKEHKLKRVNPIKLNFDSAIDKNNSVDHFAEEFDGSPPLSLE